MASVMQATKYLCKISKKKPVMLGQLKFGLYTLYSLTGNFYIDAETEMASLHIPFAKAGQDLHLNVTYITTTENYCV